MNIHFQQVERKSQLFSHLAVAFAAVTVLILALSIVRNVETHWSVPSVSIQTAQIEHSDIPVAIPAPVPPSKATTANSTPEPDGNAIPIVIPQAIPAPAPSVP